MNFISKKPATLTLILLLGLVSSGYLFAHHIHGFLSPNAPIEAQVLVVEGWMSDLQFLKVADHLSSRHYDIIIVTGGPLEKGSFLSEYKTHAELGRTTLMKITGRKDIIAVPVPSVQKDRTEAAALALRRWLEANGNGFETVNIVSSGVHARRSQYLFRRALGDHYRVGIIAIASSGYDPKRWWSSSGGFKAVILETLAYLHARLILPFYDDFSSLPVVPTRDPQTNHGPLTMWK